jgi:cytochrome c-type biogenesis protein CcmH
MSLNSGFLVAVLLATAPQPAANVDILAREIESALIAPCCFRQQVSVHSSPAADEVRHDVRTRLAAGQTRAQILDAYVAQYGKRILAEPPAEGVGVALQIVPVVMAVIGVVLLVLVVRHLTSRRPPVPAAAGPGQVGLTVEEHAQLDEVLRDLD